MALSRCKWQLFTTLLILIVGVVGLRPVSAQVEWSAWVYDSGQMFRVGTAGLLETFDLPLPEGYDLPPEHVAVAPNGTLMAYVATQSSGDGQSLAIYDHARRSVIAFYAIPNPLQHSLSFGTQPIFDSSSTQLAFGYSMQPEGWEIIVVDMAQIAAGTLAAILPDDGLASGAGVTPVVQQMRPDGKVAFALVESGEIIGSYLWQPGGIAVETTNGYAALDGDLFTTTDEWVFPFYDERVPEQPNTLQVYSATTGARFPFYGDAAPLANPRFIWNGQYIMAQAGDVWRLIGRDGQVFGELPAELGARSVAGTPDGFIYFTTTTPTLTLQWVNLAGGALDAGVPIWDSGITIAEGETTVQVVWVGVPGAVVEPSSGYVQWARAASPIFDEEGRQTFGATPTPQPDTVLRVGGTATVSTTGADRLNVRIEPGIEYRILERLSRGDQVTITEGPQVIGQFTWWKVQTANGSEGWVVEVFDNVVTLVPGTSLLTGDVVVDESQNTGADPTLQSELQIGDEVQVTGGTVRLRNEAGLNGRVIVEMPEGTQLRVVAGPTELDNYIWWQVRTPEGNTGWSAEIVGRERVLVKGTVLANATGTPGSGTAGAPILISPQAAAVISVLPRDVAFSWSRIEGLETYEFTLETCTGGTCTPVVAEVVTGTTYSTTLEADGAYRWRVTGNGGVSDWRSFTVDTSAVVLPAPALLSPATGSEFTNDPRTVRATWAAVPGAANYRVEVEYCANDNPADCTPMETLPTTTETEYTFTFVGIQPGQWRVVPYTADGAAGSLSEWRTFRFTQ